jgi:hypothetical protein
VVEGGGFCRPSFESGVPDRARAHACHEGITETMVSLYKAKSMVVEVAAVRPCSVESWRAGIEAPAPYATSPMVMLACRLDPLGLVESHANP